jgi:conjugative transfer signal peptidase TraF
MIKLLYNKVILIICFSVILIVISGSLTPLFYINCTSSQPRGIYCKVLFQSNFKPGDLVLVQIPRYISQRNSNWLRNDILLLKQIGAVAGDEIKITDQCIFINDQIVGPISDKDSLGRPLPKIRGNFTIKPGHFLPISTHIPNSFDGRYFGQIPLKSIKGKVIPIFLFD